ncbi:Trp biosynthesis-associated membrane protein [Actinoplanes sp. NBRC 101535]|uniref:Trp biosynthesis-associated membrane protein n=1 Tax=Actinoplanes sp. NBRC 101535 TaxID=3032196 RepID=UPI00255704F6|nr:Trp biosynthesis-associated membrane protein [Actinoplanes sp. NBRC 101535]
MLASLVACLAGGGLILWSVTRVWTVEVEQRTGLPELRTEQTGADLHPWLVGLALVALAGAGVLLVARGPVRRGLGGLISVVGTAMAAGAVVAWAGVASGVWPGGALLGSAVVVLGGVLAARHGDQWSGMSARYERSTSTSVPVVNSPASDTRAAWDALDRGDDPTA